MQPAQPAISIVTPCYNESSVVIRFLESLEHTLPALSYQFDVIVINDCSADDTLLLLEQFTFTAANCGLHIITLETNSGHQAAIFRGLLYAGALNSSHCIVMDSDGQDAPGVITELLKYRSADIVHVVRGKRHESWLFRSCYFIYRLVFRVATGKQINYGNFSLISRNVMDRAAASGFSHFPAFLAKQKVPRHFITASRPKRLGGKSKMSFGKLVLHAYCSITEIRNRNKLSRLLPILGIVVLANCTSSQPANSGRGPSSGTHAESRPFSIFIYPHEHSLAFGNGYQYTITNDSLKISYHRFSTVAHDADSVILRRHLPPSPILQELSLTNIGALDDLYRDPRVTDGCQLYFTCCFNGKYKTIEVENRYVPELGHLVSLVNALVPDQYRIWYDSLSLNTPDQNLPK